jgi:hypothetical protein
MGQTGEDWPGSVWDMNSKYADSNGDGVISTDDASAIDNYFLRAHTLVPEITGLKADYAFELVPLVTDLDSGDLAVFEVHIGSENDPVLDMHGLSFSLNLPENAIDMSTVQMDFDENSWLGHDAPSVDLDKAHPEGRFDAAFSRINGKPASGAGAIGILTCIVTDDIEGFKTPDGRKPIHIEINGVNSMATNGLLYDVDGTGATVYLSATETSSSSLEDQVFLYPNPSNGEAINIHANGDRSLKQVDILDLSGAMLGTQDGLTSKHHSQDISSLPTGLYFLRVTTTDGVVTKKFEVVK